MDQIPMSTLDEFIALVKGRALARVNRYAVGFNVPPGLVGTVDPNDVRDVAMLCDEASIPGKQIMARSLRINALSEPRAHTMDFWNDTASFSFLIDNNWTARRFFEDWMTLCIGPGRTLEVGDYDQYISNVNIYSLAPAVKFNEKRPMNPTDDVLWGVKLIDAWPRSIIIMPVSYANTTIHRMTVTFMYKRWISLDAFGENREERLEKDMRTTEPSIPMGTPASLYDDVAGGVLGSATAKQLYKEDVLATINSAKNTIVAKKNVIDSALADFDSTMQGINSTFTDIKKKVDPYLSQIDQVNDRFTIVRKKLAPFIGR